MPRLKQNAEKYAMEGFQTEIRKKQGEYDLMSVRALAREIGIPHTTLGPKLKEPDKLEVADLRKIVTTIDPDPGVVLALLGYDRKAIRRFQQRATVCEEVAG